MENKTIKPQSLVAKARRRIRKFIATGEHQPRTYAAGEENRFRYRVKHDNPTLDLFFMLKNNKLIEEKDDGYDKLPQKKYGMVKEVKQRKVKLKKPDVRDLARYYRAVAKYGVWQQLDNMCFAINWWEEAVAWFSSNTPPGELTTAQARFITRAMEYRKSGLKASSDKQKISAFVSAIGNLEALAKIIDLKVPKLAKYIAEGEESAKKNKEILSKLEPRFGRITDLLAKMFPSCTMSIVVVPRIVEPVTGKDIGRKMDHTKSTFYYSRDFMKALRKQIRNEGYLAFAIQEAYWLARAMSFKAYGDPTGSIRMPDPANHLLRYQSLLEDFNHWARKSDTPTRLARKPAKKKTEKVKVAVEKEWYDDVEEDLATGEVVSMYDDLRQREVNNV